MVKEYESRFQFTADFVNTFIKETWKGSITGPPVAMLFACAYPLFFAGMYSASFGLLKKERGKYVPH
jgi:hypothetical protein